MTFKILFAPLAMLTVAACDNSRTASDREATASLEASSADDATPSPSPFPTMVSPVGGGDGVNDGEPDLVPPALTPEAARGEKGARNVLLSWARAIELREFDQAWNLFGAAGKERWSRAAFARVFAGLEEITVAVPGGAMEGAAGSSYYTSQAAITALDADGRPIRIEGPVVLRRVNDVPGATPEQLRWHIESADLAVTH